MMFQNIYIYIMSMTKEYIERENNKLFEEMKYITYDDDDEKIKDILNKMNIGENPENQTDVIDYFTNAERKKLTFKSPIKYPTEEDSYGDKLKVAIDFTSDLEKNYEEIDDGKYYVFCLNLSDQNPFNMKQTKFYKNEIRRLFYPSAFGRRWKRELDYENIDIKELYQIKIDQISEMLDMNVLKKNNEIQKYKNYKTLTTYIDKRLQLFPYAATFEDLPSTTINKFGEKLRLTNPEKWEEWKTRYQKFKQGKQFWKPNKYFEISGVHRNIDGTVKVNEYSGGNMDKNLYEPEYYKRWNGDPFYVYDRKHDMYRLQTEVKGYKTEEEINEIKNPKSSIHALIILKICINQDIELDKYPEEIIPRPTATVSILMQYERIIVNNKLYSELYMDKKIVETLCDDEPVESGTELLDVSKNLGMFKRNDSMKSSDSTNSSGYTLGSAEEDRSGGRKKTRHKKHKKTKRKNKTKRDKTHKKNKKRTRRMRR